MNQEYKNLIYIIIGLFFYSILHTMGSFGYKYWKNHGKQFSYIFLVSVFLGTISYFIKVPLFYFYASQTAVLTYIIYMVELAIVVTIYSKIVLKEHIALHTYITLLILILLVGYNQYLIFNDKPTQISN